VLPPFSPGVTTITPAVSLASTINAAADGDVIVLGDGTYHVADVQINKNITLMAATAGNVVLTAQNRYGRTVFQIFGGTIWIHGVRITGGYRPQSCVGCPARWNSRGGGFEVTTEINGLTGTGRMPSAINLTMTNCEIDGNGAEEGGGFYVRQHLHPIHMLIRNCNIHNNQGLRAYDDWGPHRGGIGAFAVANVAGAAFRGGSFTAEHCNVYNNYAWISKAIDTYNMPVRLRFCNIYNNRVSTSRGTGPGGICINGEVGMRRLNPRHAMLRPLLVGRHSAGLPYCRS
jgi:hypothetical protein